MTCPVWVNACDTFDVDYNFTSTNSGYPYEVRKLYVDRFTDYAEWDQCTYDENVTPECVEHGDTFGTMCPQGGATQLRMGIPVSDVRYTVGCLSSTVIDEDMCNALPDAFGQDFCTVECRYDLIDYDLVFNVTAPPTSSAECELFMWYNDSTDWCQIYPQPAAACATEPYTAITGGESKVVIPEQLSVFKMTNVVAPTRYRWNVRCVGVAGVAMAEDDWTFTAYATSC